MAQSDSSGKKDPRRKLLSLPVYGNYCGVGHGDPTFETPPVDAVDLVDGRGRTTDKRNSRKFVVAISEPRHVVAAEHLSKVINHGCHVAERRHKQSEET